MVNLSLRAALPPPKSVRAAGAFGNPETVSKVFALVEVAPVSCKTCCIGERRFRPRACWVRPRPLHGRRIRLDRRFRPWRFLPVPTLRLPFWRWRRHSDQRRNGHRQHQRTDGNQHRASGQLERLPGLSERAVGLGGNSGQIATTETEPASNPAGASGTRATAGMGDAFTSSFMAVPFANGNATVSLQRLVGKVVSRTCMRRRQARRSAAQGAGSAPLLPARMPFPILCR